MDNEREVIPRSTEKRENTSLIEQTKAFFLQVAIDDFKTAQAQYNLNDEFAKTKRNRNIFVIAVILLTSVVFIGFAFLLNNYYEKKNNTVQIKTSEFDDINLRDLLDKAKKLEADLGFANVQIQSLQNDRTAEIARATSDKEDKLTLARSHNIAVADLETQKTLIETNYQKRVDGIRNSYAARIKALQDQVVGYQEQLKTFDSRKLDLAKQQEVVLNNERRVYDMERIRVQQELEANYKHMTEDYESRLRQRNVFIKDLETSFNDALVREQNRLKELYNPIWGDDRATALFAEPIDSTRLDQYKAMIPRRLVSELGVGQDTVDAINRQLSDYRYLIGLFNKVPYSGSVPAALTQIQYRTLAVMDEATKVYDDLWQKIDSRNKAIAEKEAQIGKFKSELDSSNVSVSFMATFMDQYMVANKQDMAILGTANDGEVLLFVRPNIDLKVGQLVYSIKANGEVGSEYEVKNVGAVRHLSLIAPTTTNPSPRQVVSIILELTHIPPRPYLTGKAVTATDQIVKKEAWSSKLRR